MLLYHLQFIFLDGTVGALLTEVWAIRDEGKLRGVKRELEISICEFLKMPTLLEKLLIASVLLNKYGQMEIILTSNIFCYFVMSLFMFYVEYLWEEYPLGADYNFVDTQK